MLNRPERWGPISIEQVREKCREFGMSPEDIDTIAGFLQRRKKRGGDSMFGVLIEISNSSS